MLRLQSVQPFVQEACERLEVVAVEPEDTTNKAQFEFVIIHLYFYLSIDLAIY